MNSLYISRFENKCFNFKKSQNNYYYIRTVTKTLTGLFFGKWRRVSFDTFVVLKSECIEKVN